MSETLVVARPLLIGRDDDLAAVAADLACCAVTTVTGPGGVGKTALALAVARAHEEMFRGGVQPVWLGAIRQPSLVAPEVAASVGLPRSGGLGYVEALVGWLGDNDVLVVLDNCEHVVEEVAPLVEQLTAELPRLRVLATSREPLFVPGEVVHRLAPLAVAATDATPDVVASSPGVRLFLERARAQVPEFACGAQEGQLIAEICRRLDGLPLAIEVAAARLSALHLDDIAACLDDLFRLLSRPGRGAEGRQRTLRSTVEWSYALLGEAERSLLRRLSVFAGSFDLGAVQAVCMPERCTRAEVADLTARLVEKSLLVRDGPGQGYRMLETIRQFAAEQLAEAGETDALQGAHARWFLELGQRAGAGLMTGGERAWLEQLERAEDDIRVALERLIGGVDRAGGLILATNLSMFWWTHGRHREGMRWLEAALTAADDAPAELRAAGWFHLGFLLAHDTDDWAGAAELLDRGIEAASAAGGEPLILGYLLCLRGECAVFAADHRLGLELTSRGLSIIRAYPDPWGAGFGLWNVGFAHLAGGDLDAAEACFEEMVAIQRQHGIGLVLMVGCNSLGEVAERRGDLSRARALYEEALQLRRELGAARLGYVHGSLARSMLSVARVALAQGDRETASRHLAEALPLAEEMRDQQLVAEIRSVVDERRDPEVGPSAALLPYGSLWQIEFGGRSAHVADAKGVRHLRELLARPHQPIPAVALSAAVAGAAAPSGDSGPMLDGRALRAYRNRLQELDEELEEADAHHDDARGARARHERDALLEELARATGLGGRSRRAGSSAERARLNVTRTIRHSVKEIAQVHPELAAHLDRSVRTGSICVYEPTDQVTWRL